jgi:large subunit ribosomal protein L9
MKVILLRDVAKLGKRFSVVEVPDGYALNQLIPKGMVEAATPLNLKRVGARMEKVSSTQANELATFTVTLAALKEVTVTVSAEANAQDHLFQAVKTTDVAAALAAVGHAVPVAAITIPEPIKALGTYTIPLQHAGTKGSVQVAVVRK